MQLCRRDCPVLPDRFEENLDRLFRDLFADSAALSRDLAEIVAELEKIL